MKAQILKYCELSWGMLTQFKAFMGWSTFSRFNPSELNTPSLRIAQATNDAGDAVVFCPVEQILFVSGYALKPTATKDEAQRAGDAVDHEIAKLGQQLGISKAMIILPKNAPDDCLENEDGEVVRVFVRRIPVNPVMGVGLPVTHSQAGKYLN